MKERKGIVKIKPPTKIMILMAYYCGVLTTTRPRQA